MSIPTSNITKQYNVINGRYRVDKCVGKGSFGEVYTGYDQENKHLVAVKVAVTSKMHILKHEYQIYLDLLRSPKPPLIPIVYWHGHTNAKTPDGSPIDSAMVMKYLGNSLEFLLQTYCGGKFTLKTTLMVSLQLFDHLMRLHSCGYVHRDIKPDNFLIGIGPERAKIFLIDFGLAKRYKTDGRIHIRPSQNKRLVGTARYASVNSHNRLELSRRDDLESLGYLMVYFLKGKLPWQGIPAATKEDKYQKIGEIKATCKLEDLCAGVPTEIYNFLAHVRSLEFKQKPNYHYLRSLLINTFNRMDYDYDYHYDWDESANQAQSFINYNDYVSAQGAPI
jgi:serine/threonine protein kinase